MYSEYKRTNTLNVTEKFKGKEQSDEDLNSFVTETLSSVTDDIDKRTPSKKMTLRIERIDEDE